MNRTTSATFLVCVFLPVTIGCASLGGGRKPGPGPQVVVSVGSCRAVVEKDTASKVDTGLGQQPEAAFCKDVEQALRAALERAGYRPVAQEAAELALKVNVTQRVRSEVEGSNLAPKHRGTVKLIVSGTVSTKGQDLERVVAEKDLDDPAQLKAQVAEAADRIASDVAGSQPVKDAKLSPES